QTRWGATRPQAARVTEPAVQAGDAGPRARMDREYHRNLGLDPRDRVHHASERFRRVHVAGAVEGGRRVTARLEPQVTQDGGLASASPITEQRVDHHVAHEVHSGGIHALPGEVVGGYLRACGGE